MAATMQSTVVLRNIACSLTPEKVKQILDDAGLRGKFSFVCVPCIPTGRSNLGYAFVCFRADEHVEECRKLFHGTVFGSTNSKKTCEVVPANGEKDVKALAQMSRRQRRGRQLGLLMCDASGEPCASAERALFLEQGARLAAAASRSPGTPVGKIPTTASSSSWTSSPSDPSLQSTSFTSSSADDELEVDSDMQKTPPLPQQQQPPTGSANPFAGLHPLQLATLFGMTNCLLQPTSTPEAYVPGAQFLFDYLVSVYHNGAKAPPGLGDGMLGSRQPKKVAMPTEGAALPPCSMEAEARMMESLTGPSGCYSLPPPGLRPAKVTTTRLAPTSMAFGASHLEPQKVDAGSLVAGFDGMAIPHGRPQNVEKATALDGGAMAEAAVHRRGLASSAGSGAAHSTTAFII